MSASTASQNPLDMIQGKIKEVEEKLLGFKQKQQPPAMFLLDAAAGSFQGVFVGGVSFWLNKNMGSLQAANTNMSPDAKAQMEKAMAMQPKTVLASVKNFMVLFGVQAGLTSAFKHYRKDDDIWNVVGPALGAGLAFSLANGQPEQAPAMAMGFAVFSGLFYKIGEWTGQDASSKPGQPPKDTRFMQSHMMLTNMALDKYHKNLRNCALTDDTIMLWNNSALKEAKIPAGPRLLILNHLDNVRTKGNTQRMLTPSYPIDMPK